MSIPVSCRLIPLAVVFSTCVIAQQPQTPSYEGTISVTSRLVVLDAVVVDRNGNPVTNLNESQFSVTEDNIPKTIKNFDPPSAHAMPRQDTDLVHSAADLPRIGRAPVNILVLDEVNTPFLQLAYARQMLEKYLKAQPEILPAPTLFVAAGYSRMIVLHDYTQSRTDLIESVKTHTADLDFTKISNSLNGDPGGSEDGMVKTLGAMLQIAQSVAGVPGRKNVIWVGTGYDNAYDLNNLSDEDHDKVVARVQQLTDKMLEARVTLYIIDPSGPQGVADPTYQPIDPSNSSAVANNIGDFGDNIEMDAFATNTGGRVIGGRNDIDAQLAQVSHEGTEYYTLSYIPTNDGNEGQLYRRIRVRVNDPSLRVITRTGYFTAQAPAPEVSLAPDAKLPDDIKFDLISAARTTMPYTALHTDAQRAKDGYALLVNENDLKFIRQPDGLRRTEVIILAVCYNKKGKETAQRVVKINETLPANSVIRPNSRVGFAFPIAIPPFTRRIRFVVRDASTGAIGTVNVNP